MSKEKIKKLNQLAKIINNLKKRRRKIIFTNGCFDILHLGHARYLEQAKKKGDVLIVGVNSDSSVRKLKGKNRPIFNQLARAEVLAALESVDFVVIFNQATPIKLIKALKPDVLVKGGDWDTCRIVGKDFVESYGGAVRAIPFVKGYSTSSTIRSIKKYL